MKAKIRVWKNKWIAIKRILNHNYFIVFTYNSPNGVDLVGQWKHHHKDVHPLINDIVESIYKEELRHD